MHFAVERGRGLEALVEGQSPELQGLVFGRTPRYGDQDLRVQVPNNHILTQNPYYNCYYPIPKYLILAYLDPWGKSPGDLRLWLLADALDPHVRDLPDSVHASEARFKGIRV